MFENLRRAYRAWANQFGFDHVRLVRALSALPVYGKQLKQFKRGYDGPLEIMPFLHDRLEEGGDTTSEYFLQDLSVAKRIFALCPKKHVDVGSRVDGFVAHIAVFRNIEVFDIRPISGVVPGITFTRADLTGPSSPEGYCDSLSCLHALEHFGLGRYGDAVDPLAWKSGLSAFARLLTFGGRLYLSVPVGRAKVFFNAHRVFAPRELIDVAQSYNLTLNRLSWIIGGTMHESSDHRTDVQSLGLVDYALGIFEFVRNATSENISPDPHS